MDELLRCDGIDFGDACAKRGLDLAQMLDERLVFGPLECLPFERCFVDLTRTRRELWLETGLRLRPISYGIYGLAILTSPTVSHFTALIDEFHAYHRSALRLKKFRSDAGELGLIFDPSDVPAEVREFTLIRDLAAAINVQLDLFGRINALSRVEIPFEASASLAALAKFQIPIVYGAPQARLYWQPGAENAILANGDAGLHGYYVRLCRREGELASAYAGADLRCRVLNTLTALILNQESEISVKLIADKLHISERTLQRRLSASGLQFRVLLTQARVELAKAALASASERISEIGFRLGYSEPAAFIRAFRATTGMSPSEFRRSEPQQLRAS